MTSQNVFYWNSADTRDHKHQRIEWSIANGYLVSINIKITDKLFNKVKIGDIILAYEPKGHKTSQTTDGQDGFCMDCSQTRTDGRQAFTTLFTVSNTPSKITSITEYKSMQDILFRNWFSNIKHCKDLDSDLEYFTKYFQNNNVIYLFPVNYNGVLPTEISTAKDSYSSYIYYGSIIRGFDSFNDRYLEQYIKKCIQLS